MNPIKKIMVAVDFSASSDAALDTAIDLARALGAELHVIHAYELRVPMVMPYEVSIPQSFVEETRHAAAAKLAGEAKKVSDAGITVQSRLSDTPAATAVSEAAADIGADLIIMGTRGNTGLNHVQLGIVAERTLRLAPCSVLTLKAAD